ncbi:MAG: M56 family metallopeptidase [Clostridia bacterium]|nr:M56 family metallopeptidase [Clostridia bacterium]
MLDTVFMQILDMSKTASIVILFIISARLILKRIPKIFSYVLWVVVLFRLLCPVSIELPVSAVPKFEPTADSYTLADESISVFGASEAAYQAVGDALNGGIDYQLIRTTERDEEGNVKYTGAQWWEVWILFGQYVWLTGIAAMVIYSIASYFKLRKKLIGAVPLRDNIFLSDYINSPFVMGLFRPKIYLPSALSESEQEYIILHEKHHIRRLDHIVKALSFAALCVHWFNPLVWLSFVLSGRDMEMSCDEAVIKKMGKDIRADYSASLLSLATGRRIIAGTPLAFGEGDTKGRIRNLANWKKPALWVTIVAVLISIVAVICFLTDPVEKINGGKNYVSVTEIDEGTLFDMEEVISSSHTLTVRKGEKEYFNATPLGGGRSNVIEFLESLSLGVTDENEIDFTAVDGYITVLSDSHSGVEIYFAENYSRLWLRSLKDTSCSSVYVVLNVEKARDFFENKEYLNDAPIWEYDLLSSAYGHRLVCFYLDNEYEVLSQSYCFKSEEYGLKGVSWSPDLNALDSTYVEEFFTIETLRNGERVDFTVTMTKVGETERGGVYFKITADDETVLGSYGNGYEYVLSNPETETKGLSITELNEGAFITEGLLTDISSLRIIQKDNILLEADSEDEIEPVKNMLKELRFDEGFYAHHSPEALNELKEYEIEFTYSGSVQGDVIRFDKDCKQMWFISESGGYTSTFAVLNGEWIKEYFESLS